MRFAWMVAACVFLSSPAQAQDARWYVGLGVGLSIAKDACDGVSGPGISCDDEDMATRLFAGYQFSRHFAVEAGYTELGKVRASFGTLGSASFEARGVEMLAVGIAPLGPQWSLYGKLGVIVWDVDFKDGTGLFGNATESGSDLAFGFGATCEIGGGGALRIEYQVYNDLGEEATTGKSDVTVLGTHLIFRF